MYPMDISDPSYIGKELVDDYKFYLNNNCFPFLKKDAVCKHTVKNDMERYLQDVITFKETEFNKNYPSIINNNLILKKMKPL